MLTRTVMLFLSGLLLAGCATQPVQTRPGTDHPANADATEAPLPPRSLTLAIHDTTLPRDPSAADMKPQMDMKNMGGMKPVPKKPGESVDHTDHGGHP